MTRVLVTGGIGRETAKGLAAFHARHETLDVLINSAGCVSLDR